MTTVSAVKLCRNDIEHRHMQLCFVGQQTEGRSISTCSNQRPVDRWRADIVSTDEIIQIFVLHAVKYEIDHVSWTSSYVLLFLIFEQTDFRYLRATVVQVPLHLPVPQPWSCHMSNQAMVAQATEAGTQSYVCLRQLRSLKDRVDLASGRCMSNLAVIQSITTPEPTA